MAFSEKHDALRTACFLPAQHPVPNSVKHLGLCLRFEGTVASFPATILPQPVQPNLTARTHLKGGHSFSERYPCALCFTHGIHRVL